MWRCLVPLLVLVAAAGCGGGNDKTVTLGKTDEVLPTQPEPAPSHAAASTKDKFLETCGACHTLKAAGANGVVGPNLDEVRPSAALVRRFIRNGSSDSVMPAGLFEGAEAREVAAYVARVAG